MLHIGLLVDAFFFFSTLTIWPHYLLNPKVSDEKSVDILLKTPCMQEFVFSFLLSRFSLSFKSWIIMYARLCFSARCLVLQDIFFSLNDNLHVRPMGLCKNYRLGHLFTLRFYSFLSETWKLYCDFTHINTEDLINHKLN